MTREEAIKFGEKFLEVSIDLNHTNAYQFVDKALKLLKQESAKEPILEKDGTLVVTTEHYENVSRVLVQHGTSGTLFYQD